MTFSVGRCATYLLGSQACMGLREALLRSFCPGIPFQTHFFPINSAVPHMATANSFTKSESFVVESIFLHTSSRSQMSVPMWIWKKQYIYTLYIANNFATSLVIASVKPMLFYCLELYENCGASTGRVIKKYLVRTIKLPVRQVGSGAHRRQPFHCRLLCFRYMYQTLTSMSEILPLLLCTNKNSIGFALFRP